MLDEPLACLAPAIAREDLTQLCEVFDAETGSLMRTTFTFVDAHHNAWFGQVDGVSKFDLEVEDYQRNLCRVPDETVYPEVTAGLTIIAEDDDLNDYYIKRPKLLCLDNPEETELLPKLLAGEAHVLEMLKVNGHRNLVQYYGCVPKDGRIAGIALEKHDSILQTRFEKDERELDIAACISGIQAGMQHLHCLGFAHNDLNPTNIALDKDDQPVILDFGSCRKFGETLLTGGTYGWIDEDYDTSARHHDEGALQKLEAWLTLKRLDKMDGGSRAIDKLNSDHAATLARILEKAKSEQEDQPPLRPS